MTIVLFAVVLNLFCQPKVHSYNGWLLPTSGNFRIFAVFAEVEGDTLELNIDRWEKGKMPEPSLIKDYQNYINNYFSEASFGALNVTMHYLDELIKIPLAEQRRNGAFKKVFENLTNRYNNGQPIKTFDGLSFPDDFDNWTLTTGRGSVKPNIPDNKIDFIAVFWRINSSLGARNGGQGNWGSLSTKIGDKHYSHRIYMYSNDITVLQHEFAHGIVGSNNFHSAPQNNGTAMFIEDYPGFSILSGNARYHPGYNGWDRYRLGWQHPSQTYKISARDEKGNEKDGDLTYGQHIGDSAVYVLRDFASTNDAVRIKLPYVRTLNPQAREQWIWIENHQLLPGKVEHVASKHGANSHMSKVPRGIYLNLQVGNENFSDFSSSRTNYISPISRFGKFDFTYQSEWPVGDGRYGDLAITDDSFANPFTGVGFNAHPADNNKNDKIESKEYKNVVGIKYNNKVLGRENFGYFTYHLFGSVYDAFYEGNKISISTNPSTTPWLTYKRSYRLSATPHTDDNRKIYLNGLNIRVLEQRANGDVKVSIRWNDFDIKNNVRWCGDIVLNEKVIVHPNCTVLLDQGLTPIKSVNPIFVNGQKVFADPTLFTAKNNSLFKIERKGATTLKRNSSYVAESGSMLELNDKSIFVIDSGSTLQIKAGANVTIKGRGKIVVKSGGYLCVEEGATINLQNYNSAIILEKGAMWGANPSLFPSISCSSTIPKTGKGSIRYR